MLKKFIRYGLPYVAIIFVIGLLGFPMACGGDGTEADQAGVGAECTTADDCNQDPDAKIVQDCLDFKGGYCGIENCVDDSDCPDGSFCVAHTDGIDYCFLVCKDKSECNINRSDANESNCSANIDFVENHPNTKACVPPSA